MKANHVNRCLIVLVALGLILLPCCAKKDKESAEILLTRYWQALFEGNVKRAYSMFTRESKKETSLEEFAARVSFGLESSPQKDSFWTEYSQICKLDMGPVNIREDTAYADVMITMPNLARLEETLSSKADSLLASQDSLERETWLMSQRVHALKEKHFMPLIMHLELKLFWELYDWRLVYE